MPSISGQTTVPSAGTSVPLASQLINGPLIVKALGSNSGSIAIGNDGNNDVTTSNGLLLSAGETVVFDFVGNLSSLYIDSENNGEGVSWLALNV